MELRRFIKAYQGKFLLLVFFLATTPAIANAQITQSVDSAFMLASQKNKSVMVVFSGSDWCASCMRFKKKVLDDRAFTHFTDSTLVVMMADFPQGKSLPPGTVKQNENLAEKYNPSGSFPFIVLFHPDQKPFVSLKYHNENSEDFINLLKQYLP